jgi:hypothetical protein
MREPMRFGNMLFTEDASAKTFGGLAIAVGNRNTSRTLSTTIAIRSRHAARDVVKAGRIMMSISFLPPLFSQRATAQRNNHRWPGAALAGFASAGLDSPLSERVPRQGSGPPLE